jgi:uncharacterized repeat protein (TIGR01451 family)
MWRAIALAVLLLAVPAHLFAQGCLDLSKEVDCEISMVGDEVIYTICVTNCGLGTLYELQVMDSLLGDISHYFPSILIAGETACANIPYVIQPDDDDGQEYPSCILENTVTAYAEDAYGSTFIEEAVELVYLVHPGLDIDVVCLTSPVPPGDEAAFEVVITNWGDIPLYVEPSDPRIPGPLLIGAFETFAGVVYEECLYGEVCLEVHATGHIPPDYCELGAAVTDGDEDCCECGSVPVEHESWGVIKAIYR